MIDPLSEYLRLQSELITRIRRGAGDGEQADALRGEMNAPWLVMLKETKHLCTLDFFRQMDARDLIRCHECGSDMDWGEHETPMIRLDYPFRISFLPLCVQCCEGVHYYVAKFGPSPLAKFYPLWSAFRRGIDAAE